MQRRQGQFNDKRRIRENCDANPMPETDPFRMKIYEAWKRHDE